MTPQPAVQTVKPRILLVDDSRSVRATLARLLDAVYDIREASDGIEAWATMLIDPTIRIVITDLTMPNLDGYGLLARVRASKIGRIRMLPLIVVSGAQETAEHDRVWAAGASGLIAKGASRAELLACLAMALKAGG
jgi:two-component system cell cycle response regulator